MTSSSALARVDVHVSLYVSLTLLSVAAIIWAIRRDPGAVTRRSSRTERALERCPTEASQCQTVATPPIASDAEGVSFPALSNAELGALWADTVRAHAVRRTRSSRDFWRKLLNEPDVLGLHAEFRRRAAERQEEYDAWLQLHEHPL